jgi:hypothetical protein
MRCKAIVNLTVASLLLTYSGCFGDTLLMLTPKEVIQKFSENRALMKSYSASVDTTSVFSDSASNKKMYNQTRDEIISDGHRIKLKQVASGIGSNLEPSNKFDMDRLVEFVWDGNVKFEYHANLQPNHRYMSAEKGDEKSHNEYLRNSLSSGTFEGFFPRESENIIDILKEAKDSSITQDSQLIPNQTTYLVEGTSEGGHYKVWFDPSRDFQIIQVEIHRSENDRVFGQPLASLFPKLTASQETALRAMGGVPLTEQEVLSQSDCVVSNISFERVSGKLIPNAATLVETDTFSDGRVQSVRRQLQRQQFVLNPPLDNSTFTCDAPEGTQVLAKSPSVVSVQWKAGKPTPQIAKQIDDQLESTINQLESDNKGVTGSDPVDRTAGSNASTKPMRSLVVGEAESWPRGWLWPLILISGFLIALGLIKISRKMRSA